MGGDAGVNSGGTGTGELGQAPLAVPVSSGAREGQGKPEAPKRSVATFRPFGIETAIPPWLEPGSPIFKESPIVRMLLIPSGTIDYRLTLGYSLNCCAWLFESLVIQAYYERWKRGLPVVDQGGSFAALEFHAYGFPLIETQDSEDGSRMGWCAQFGTRPAEEAEIREFQRLIGEGFLFTAFDGPHRRCAINPPGTPVTKRSRDLGMYLIGKPDILEVRLRAADPVKNPFAPKSTAHGSAQWAWKDELIRQKIISGVTNQPIRGHSLLGFTDYRFPEHPDLDLYDRASFDGEGHRLIIGPPGTGKFTSVIAPLLLMSADADSALVVDPKSGEAVRATSKHRRDLGEVAVIDPFGVTGLPPASINPLDLLTEDGPDLVITAEQLADALFLPSKGGDEHWNRASKNLLTALLMHVGTSKDEPHKDLRRVRDIVRARDAFDDVVTLMAENTAGDGAIQAEALSILHAGESDAGRYRFYILDGLATNLAFLNAPQFLTSMEKTTFDPVRLRQELCTLYIVSPQDRIFAVGRWIRLLYTYVMERMKQLPAEEAKHKLHVVLDEFPALGRFERVAHDMALTRSLGVHMHVIVQSLAQLQRAYGEDWSVFQGTSAVTQVLGVRDNFTAKEISTMLGTTTVPTKGHSKSRGPKAANIGEQDNFAGRALMTADELMTMPKDQAIAIITGMNPVKLTKLNYYEHEMMMKDAGMMAAEPAAVAQLPPVVAAGTVEFLPPRGDSQDSAAPPAAV